MDGASRTIGSSDRCRGKKRGETQQCSISVALLSFASFSPPAPSQVLRRPQRQFRGSAILHRVVRADSPSVDESRATAQRARIARRRCRCNGHIDATRARLPEGLRHVLNRRSTQLVGASLGIGCPGRSTFFTDCSRSQTASMMICDASSGWQSSPLHADRTS